MNVRFFENHDMAVVAQKIEVTMAEKPKLKN